MCIHSAPLTTVSFNVLLVAVSRAPGNVAVIITVEIILMKLINNNNNNNMCLYNKVLICTHFLPLSYITGFVSSICG